MIAFYMRDQPDSIEKNSADFFVSRDKRVFIFQ